REQRAARDQGGPEVVVDEQLARVAAVDLEVAPARRRADLGERDEGHEQEGEATPHPAASSWARVTSASSASPCAASASAAPSSRSTTVRHCATTSPAARARFTASRSEPPVVVVSSTTVTRVPAGRFAVPSRYCA